MTRLSSLAVTLLIAACGGSNVSAVDGAPIDAMTLPDVAVADAFSPGRVDLSWGVTRGGASTTCVEGRVAAIEFRFSRDGDPNSTVYAFACDAGAALVEGLAYGT